MMCDIDEYVHVYICYLFVHVLDPVKKQAK
jgi:hypothetical protein